MIGRARADPAGSCRGEAGRASSERPRGSGEPPRDSFQHLEQRPARSGGTFAASGVAEPVRGCTAGRRAARLAFSVKLLWLDRAGAPEVVLSPLAQVTSEFSCAARREEREHLPPDLSGRTGATALPDPFLILWVRGWKQLTPWAFGNILC